MLKDIMKFEEERKSIRRSNALEMINKRVKGASINEAESVKNVGAGLALDLFGKVFGGDPNSGVVPGAKAMSQDELRQITYNVIVATLKKNGLDENLADEWFMKWYGKSYK